MEISDLRNTVQMSQRQFAQYFGIPVGTLRNWEQGIAKPPDYVFKMIFASIRRDKMINVETIKFMRTLDELAELSKNGIEPFDNVSEDTWRKKIFYDMSGGDNEAGYEVVFDAVVIDDPSFYHHDIVSYGSSGLEYTLRVKIDEYSCPYVEVRFVISEDIVIIEKGHWYFA